MLNEELKIGVISDTHVRAIDELPDSLLTTLADVDLIIHAGDFTEKAVLDGLTNLGEVKAVLGNMDSAELRMILPKHDLFTVRGKRIGLIHGWGMPWGLAESVKDLFPDADIIIFGHSHNPVNEEKDGILFFNPGSATDKVFSRYCSFGIIEIEEGNIRAEIIRL